MRGLCQQPPHCRLLVPTDPLPLPERRDHQQWVETSPPPLPPKRATAASLDAPGPLCAPAEGSRGGPMRPSAQRGLSAPRAVAAGVSGGSRSRVAQTTCPGPGGRRRNTLPHTGLFICSDHLSDPCRGVKTPSSASAGSGLGVVSAELGSVSHTRQPQPLAPWGGLPPRGTPDPLLTVATGVDPRTVMVCGCGASGPPGWCAVLG